MTADRLWVRIIARWLARVDGVSEMIKLSMLGLTGLSTALLTLREYGYGRFAWPLIIFVILGSLTFTYLYTEKGVWNQKARDTRDLSSNFAGPTQRINTEMISRGILAAEKGETLSEEERQAIKEELDKSFYEYREGIDLEETEKYK